MALTVSMAVPALVAPHSSISRCQGPQAIQRRRAQDDAGLHSKTDEIGPLSDQPGHTRMTVGRSRGQRTQSMDATGGPLADRLNSLNLEPTIEEGWQKPGRPGRMESEDQEGEIVLPGITTGAEDVAGLQGRIRLARADGPGTMALGRPAAATSNLPMTSSSKWMDTQRHLLQAYEYLCHCGEAKEWMELHVGEHLGDVVEMENEMRNGIFLAKLAKQFEPDCVPRIFVHPKLQYRHTDNINYFFAFINKVGLPHFFQFELTDLYEKKNFPRSSTVFMRSVTSSRAKVELARWAISSASSSSPTTSFKRRKRGSMRRVLRCPRSRRRQGARQGDEHRARAGTGDRAGTHRP